MSIKHFTYWCTLTLTLQAFQSTTIEDTTMNMTIYLFLLAGAGFGIITFPVRHLFSEGPHKADETENADALSGRVFWVMVCTFLWPIMVLTGLNSARILIKRRAKQDA
jgi:hypothetical protein